MNRKDKEGNARDVAYSFWQAVPHKDQLTGIEKPHNLFKIKTNVFIENNFNFNYKIFYWPSNVIILINTSQSQLPKQDRF